MLQPSLPGARRCLGTGTPHRKPPSWSWCTAKEVLRGKGNEAQVARAKSHQELRRVRRGVWVGSRLGRRKPPQRSKVRQWDNREWPGESDSVGADD